MWILKEKDSEFLGSVRMVGSGMGEDGVALTDKGFGEELTEVAEANDGDFETVIRGG